MKSNNLHRPIFITGVERSGASFISKILNLSGAYIGKRNKMFESIELNKVISIILNNTKKPLILPETAKLQTFSNFEQTILSKVRKCEKTHLKWLCKNTNLSLLWPLFHEAFPEAQWIIVRRKTPYLINSCIKTGYMRLMKEEKTLHDLGLSKEEDGWKWLIHQYEHRWEDMMKAGLDVKEIWPDRFEKGDFSKIKEIVEWAGLEWKEEKVKQAIQPMFKK
jgi:hypothetical protein